MSPRFIKLVSIEENCNHYFYELNITETVDIDGFYQTCSSGAACKTASRCPVMQHHTQVQVGSINPHQQTFRWCSHCPGRPEGHIHYSGYFSKISRHIVSFWQQLRRIFPCLDSFEIIVLAKRILRRVWSKLRVTLPFSSYIHVPFHIKCAEVSLITDRIAYSFVRVAPLCLIFKKFSWYLMLICLFPPSSFFCLFTTKYIIQSTKTIFGEENQSSGCNDSISESASFFIAPLVMAPSPAVSLLKYHPKEERKDRRVHSYPRLYLLFFFVLKQY